MDWYATGTTAAFDRLHSASPRRRLCHDKRIYCEGSFFSAKTFSPADRASKVQSEKVLRCVNSTKLVQKQQSTNISLTKFAPRSIANIATTASSNPTKSVKIKTILG
jgi:hypothetical protein